MFMVIYEPWLEERLERLRLEVEAIPNMRQRLERILYAFWRDMPKEDNNFTNNFMQALSSADLAEGYTREPFMHTMKSVARMLLPRERATPAQRRKARAIAHLLLMAFDGFVMNYRLNGSPAELDEIVALMAGMLQRSVSAEDA
jgi:hypothetical protein